MIDNPWPNVFCGLWTADCGLADSQTRRLMGSQPRTGNIYTAGMLCSLPLLQMQQFPYEPWTATGVVGEL